MGRRRFYFLLDFPHETRDGILLSHHCPLNQRYQFRSRRQDHSLRPSQASHKMVSSFLIVIDSQVQVENSEHTSFALLLLGRKFTDSGYGFELSRAQRQRIRNLMVTFWTSGRFDTCRSARVSQDIS